jgi:hypothetical protein
LGLRPDEVDPVEAYASELALLPVEDFEVHAARPIIADPDSPVLTGDPWLDREELELHDDAAWEWEHG